jgi:hypothetical protein
MPVRREDDGAITVPSGSGRAEFALMTRTQLASRYPGVALDGLPERGGAGLVIAAELTAAQKALGAAGVPGKGRICVAPPAANGTLLVFTDT